MPRYRVLVRSYINNAIREEGDVVEYDGRPGSNLELIKAPKEAKAQKAEAAKPADGAADLV